MSGWIDNNMSLVSLYWTSSLIKDGYGFLAIDMSCHLITGSRHLENDGMDKTHTINIAYDHIKFIAIVFCMSSICSYDHEIMQLTETRRVPCVYETSQHNWVTIKMLHRYLWGCLLGWHGSRLGFVTLYDVEVSRGTLCNTSSQWGCKQCDYRVRHRILYYGTSKETCQ